MITAFRVGTTTVDVESTDVAALAWLTEFLTPWADVVSPGRAAWRVSLLRSDARFSALQHERTSASTRPIPCFSLDADVLRLPGWASGEGVVVVDDDLSGFIAVEGAAVTITARPELVRARLCLMRVVRELLAAPLRAQASTVELHAAAFAVGGRAVLIAGRKSSGKTTMLAHALASAGASLIANDRVVVGGAQPPFMATGIPTLVSVRPWTLDLYPALRRTPDERPSSLCVNEEPPAGAAAEYAAAPPRNFAVSPAQFGQRLGVGLERQAPVAAVVLPTLSSHVETWAVEPLDPETAAGALRACVYGSAGARVPTIFESAQRPAALEEETRAVIDRLVADAHLVRATLGPDAYRERAHGWMRAFGLAGALLEQPS